MAGYLDSLIGVLQNVPLAPQNPRTPGQGDWTPTVGGEALAPISTNVQPVEARTFAPYMTPEEEQELLTDFSVGRPPEGAEPQPQPLDPNPGEPPEETDVRQQAIITAQNSPTPTPETDNLLQENPNASVEQVTSAVSTDMKSAAESAAKEDGSWTTAWQDAWDQFNDKVDLFTLGVALATTADNGRSLTVNLGAAIGAGAAAKTMQKERDRKHFQEDFENRLAKKKLDVQIADTYTKRMNSWSARQAALAKLNNYDVVNAGEAGKAAARAELARMDVPASEFAGMSEEEVYEELGSAIRSAQQNATSPEEAARISRVVTEQFMAQFHDTGFMFGTNYERKQYAR